MASYEDIEKYADELAKAARTLAQWHRSQQLSDGSTTQTGPGDTPDHIRLAKACLSAKMAKIQQMTDQPSDLIQRLALNTQLLACLQWLCEFQVLACIPLDIAVPFGDVAEISGVPESQLRRVTRLMATVGFLVEPRSGYISHSLLSAQFVTQPALLDAAVFLSGTVAPAALKMPYATRQFGASDLPDDSAYSAVLNSKVPVSSIFSMQPKLQRQFSTYLAHALGDCEVAVQDTLMSMEWLALGSATVVDVGPASCATANKLALQFPALDIVVQSYNAPGTLEAGAFSFAALPHQPPLNVTIQHRAPGALQTVSNAAIYILRLPSPTPTTPWDKVVAQTASELRAHVEILRANPSAKLILTALVLPSPATAKSDYDVQAHLRDISIMQLFNGRQIEKDEVIDIVHRIVDSAGGLVRTGEYQSPTSSLVAFEIRYQAGQTYTGGANGSSS